MKKKIILIEECRLEKNMVDDFFGEVWEDKSLGLEGKPGFGIFQVQRKYTFVTSSQKFSNVMLGWVGGGSNFRGNLKLEISRFILSLVKFC